MATIEEVIDDLASELMGRFPADVVEVSQGEVDGRACIVVGVKRRSPEIDEAVPTAIAGYPVEIRERGEYQAQGVVP